MQQQQQNHWELSYKNTFYPFDIEAETEGLYGHKTIHSRHQFQQIFKLVSSDDKELGNLRISVPNNIVVLWVNRTNP